MRRSLFAAILAVALGASLVPGLAAAGVGAPLLPDLRMAPLAGIRLQVVGDQRQLRFDTVVVDTGAGPIEVVGSRASTSDPMTVSQRIYDSGGGYSDTPTTATMFFAGDGHTHWHIEDFETYILRRHGRQVGQAIKSGYCFFDNVAYDLGLPGAPATAVYDPASVCAKDQPDALTAMAGLSVGWGDRYSSVLPDQYIDITRLDPGVYRLVAIADRNRQFTESDETNNRTWVKLHIRKRWIQVLSYGPPA